MNFNFISYPLCLAGLLITIHHYPTLIRLSFLGGVASVGVLRCAWNIGFAFHSFPVMHIKLSGVVLLQYQILLLRQVIAKRSLDSLIPKNPGNARTIVRFQLCFNELQGTYGVQLAGRGPDKYGLAPSFSGNAPGGQAKETVMLEHIKPSRTIYGQQQLIKAVVFDRRKFTQPFLTGFVEWQLGTLRFHTFTIPDPINRCIMLAPHRARTCMFATEMFKKTAGM